MKITMTGTILAVLAMAAAPGAAMAADGAKVFKKCAACHSLDPGKNKIGPSLSGVHGATAGQVAGFKYSDVMVNSGVVWDDTTLDAYLAKPKDFMPGNKMTFPGLKKPDDRAALIEFLKSN